MIEYQEIRHWGPVVGSLPFIALMIGILFAGAANVYNNTYYLKRFRENGNKAVPEARLPPMMIGGFMFTGGLFLFGCKPHYQSYDRLPILTWRQGHPQSMSTAIGPQSLVLHLPASGLPASSRPR
jgi:hypothetical protein